MAIRKTLGAVAAALTLGFVGSTATAQTVYQDSEGNCFILVEMIDGTLVPVPVNCPWDSIGEH